VRGGRHRPAPGGLDTEEVVMAETKRRLSEDERAERRARDRERLQHAAEQLLTSDGWQRWVRARALFHNYSLHNCLLLAAQCHERGIEATRVAGFRTWLKLGRCVRKGEKGLVVLAPIPIKRGDNERGEAADEARVVFRSAFCSPTRRPTRCRACSRTAGAAE
jgi:N-terminal domain of anti-restriction factor ArdC